MDKQQLLMLANRGLTLNGSTYRGIYKNPKGDGLQLVSADEENRAYFTALANDPTVGNDLTPNASDSDEIKEAKVKMQETINAAMGGDRQAKLALASIRLEMVDNFVKAGSSFASFFEQVTLKDGERPYVQNTTMNEVAVGYLSQDGKPRMLKLERETAETAIDLRFISSPKVWYRTQDIYRGKISELATKTIDIAFDITQQIDQNCKNLLTATLANGGAYGAFTFTGAKPTRVYVPHSAIVSANLPTTNAVTVNGTTAAEALNNTGTITGKFGVRTLQEIIRYADSWGTIFADGRLVPTGEILVPSKDVFAILTDFTPTANTAENQIQNDIATKGYTSLSYGGRIWRFIPDVTLAAGTCYPKFNKMAGRMYTKPSLDAEFVETNNEKNEEHRWQRKVIGLYIINQLRMNTAKFTYV